MIVPFVFVALSSLTSASSAPELAAPGLDGRPVALTGVTALVVDPDDRDELQATLRAVREQAQRDRREPARARLKALVIVVDLSDVPSFLRGFAVDSMKERAEEVATRPVAREISLSWVADMDGTISDQLRGDLKGSCLVTTDDRGGHARGMSVEQLAATVATRARAEAAASP